MPETVRLFVGTFLDAEEARSVFEIKQINSKLSERWSLKARFVPLEKLHLTWLFIGDVERRLVETIKSDLKIAIGNWKTMGGNSAFPITYEQIEVWPSLKSPRVLVLESTVICPQAESLNNSITTGLEKYLAGGEMLQSKPVKRFKRFRPHLTICRFAPAANQMGAYRGKRLLADFAMPAALLPLRHEIKTVSLIESELSAGPNGYSSIADFVLD